MLENQAVSTNQSTPVSFHKTGMIPFTLLVSLATFNIRGLGNEVKQYELNLDCKSYNLDIIALQETKVLDGYERVFKGTGNKLFIFNQTDSNINQKGEVVRVYQRGIGFLVSKRLLPCVTVIHQISDRVAYLELNIPSRSGQCTRCRVVNAYGPTSPSVRDNPVIADMFYRDLRVAMSAPKNYELFICGDLNSKIGKLSKSDIDLGVSNHVGKFAIGTRNENGSNLLEFLIEHDLFLANTAFQHKSRHLTTRTGRIKDWSDPSSNKSKPFYSMIDYVICRRRFKSTLVDSRSYGGTQVDSDHKVVVARFQFKNRHLTFPKYAKSDPKFDCNLLAANPDIQMKYSTKLSASIQERAVNSDVNDTECNLRVDSLIKSIKNAAKDTVGMKPKQVHRDYTNDAEIAKMSEERHTLRMLLLSSNAPADTRIIRTKINLLKNNIAKRLVLVKELRAQELADRIESTDESRRMFEAVRELKSNTSKKNNHKQSVSVYDAHQRLLCTDTGKAAALKTWFESQFTNKHTEPSLPPLDGPPRPLNTPITPTEVKCAAMSLKNGRATGPDGVQNELLKYGGGEFHYEYSKIINTCFETNTHLTTVGEGVITPLQKPGKAKGPLTSIRPLTLSNSFRKILSLITLRRIQQQVDNYTGPWQAAYKRGRSCGDLVWCQRMLLAVVMERHWSFHKMGIDMSAAFDTIQRSTVLNLLKDAGCSEDDIRLVRFLLSNTLIKIRIDKTYSVVFETTLGSFQGDSLSGCLFTLVLAGALNHLRTLIPFRSNPPFNVMTSMPEEDEYSDDTDFLGEELIQLDFILPVAAKVFKEWSLNINEAKTEFIHFYYAEPDKDSKEEVLDDEPWRKSKLLGSYMCSSYDIQQKCILGNLAFSNFNDVWLQGKRISLPRLINVYEAMVVSVMMYNCSSWAATKDTLKKLDVCHRKHLRKIINVKCEMASDNLK